jgi:hypothetical protein
MYRSRFEARIAVLFDAYGRSLVYEPDAVKVGGSCYLPDFYIPSMRTFLEVKGCWDDPLYKPRRLADALFPDFGVCAAVNGIPNAKQLALHGWWDGDGQLGIKDLSATVQWASWFPPTCPAVREACEIARSYRFDRQPPPGQLSLPFPRNSS